HLAVDDARIAELDRDLAAPRETVLSLDTQITACQDEVNRMGQRAALVRSRLEQHRQRRDGLHEEVSLNHRGICAVETETQNLEAAGGEVKRQAEAADEEVAALETRLEEADGAKKSGESKRQERQLRLTQAKVAAAQIEERLTALRAKAGQLETDHRQRENE